jgi:Flp pilus assembly protein TadD
MDCDMKALLSSSPRLNRLLAFHSLDPSNLALRQDAVQAACETGDLRIARVLVDIGLQLHARDPELLAQSGYVHLHDGRPLEAEDALRAVLMLGWASSEVHYNLAVALSMQLRYADALEHLCEPVLSFELPAALPLAARCLHKLCRQFGETAGCEAWVTTTSDATIRRLLALLRYGRALDDDGSEAMQRGGESSSRDSGGARERFLSRLQASRQCEHAHLGSAFVALGRLDFASAGRQLQLASDDMPDDVDMWTTLAWVHLLRGDVAAAKSAFNRALTIDRPSSESMGGLALVAALEGREEDARSGIRRSRNLDPHSMSARYAEMLLLERGGRSNEVRTGFDTVLARPFPTAHARLNKGLRLSATLAAW